MAIGSISTTNHQIELLNVQGVHAVTRVELNLLKSQLHEQGRVLLGYAFAISFEDTPRVADTGVTPVDAEDVEKLQGDKGSSRHA